MEMSNLRQAAEPLIWWHQKSDTFTSGNLISNFDEWTPLYTAPPQRKPLTDDEIWKNDAIMSANSGYGATFETLREVIRAIQAAHGIEGKA